jgi:RimJ/RimL family protein N-acetyltransferase
MYTYKNIGFRPIEERDLEDLRDLYNDMTTFLQLGRAEMVSSEEQVEWWKRLARSAGDKHYAIVETGPCKLLGKLRVQNIDHVNKHCEIGLDILPALRGRGYGRMAYEMILQYLFLHNNMHMVYLRVGEFNERAKGLYEKLGFVETGRYKEYLFRHGRYWDYVIMTMTREQYSRTYGSE